MDHIVPRSLHGLDHPCNYCLMPTRVNSAFGARVVTLDLLQGLQGQGEASNVPPGLGSEGLKEGEGEGEGVGGGQGGGLKEEVVGTAAYREAVRFHRGWMGSLMPRHKAPRDEEGLLKALGRDRESPSVKVLGKKEPHDHEDEPRLPSSKSPPPSAPMGIHATPEVEMKPIASLPPVVAPLQLENPFDKFFCKRSL